MHVPNRIKQNRKNFQPIINQDKNKLVSYHHGFDSLFYPSLIILFIFQFSERIFCLFVCFLTVLFVQNQEYLLGKNQKDFQKSLSNDDDDRFSYEFHSKTIQPTLVNYN